MSSVEPSAWYNASDGNGKQSDAGSFDEMISRKLLWPIMALCLAGLAWPLLRGDSNRTRAARRKKICSELIGIFGKARPSDGRLSCDFLYSPHRISQVRLFSGRGLANQIAGFNSHLKSLSPLDARWGEALLSLLVGSPERAFRNLRIAVSNAPDDPALQSDLAAVLLALHEHSGQANDLFLALVAAERAVELDPQKPEARFNLAIALDRFFLESQAVAQWKAYLRMDSGSEWALEVASRARVRRPDGALAWRSCRDGLRAAASRGDKAAILFAIQEFPHQARIYAEEELLADWGAHWLANNTEAAQLDLILARLLGEELAKRNGDFMVAETVAAISDALGSTNKGRSLLLAQGHQAYARGLLLQRKKRDSEALTEFEDAARMLARGSSPFSAWAELDSLISRYYKGSYQPVLSGLGALVRHSNPERYPTLFGRVLWITGLVNLKLGLLSNSLAAYHQALEIFTRVGEVENQAALHFLIAENFRFQGEIVEAWSHRLSALRMGRALGGGTWLHNTLFDSAEAASRQGGPAVALLFQNEMIEDPAGLKEPVSLAESFLRRARTKSKLHRQAEAARDLAEAEKWTRWIVDEQRRLPLEADIKMARGELLLLKNPQKARGYLGQAIDFHRERENLVRLPPLLFARAKASLRAGEEDIAEADLREGIEAYEAYQVLPISQRLRSSYDDLAAGLYDSMVELQIRHSQPYRAFEYFERSRLKRFDLDVEARFDGRASEEALRQRLTSLPSDVCVVGYSLLDKTAHAWTFADGRFSVANLETSRSDAEDLVFRFRLAVLRASAPNDVKAFGKVLYQRLVAPLGDCFKPGGRVVIIPDKALYRLPFVLLVDPHTNRFLLETSELSYSPSASSYLQSRSRDEELRRLGYAGAFVLGDPAVDRGRYPDLLALPGARQEAVAVGAIYPSTANSEVLIAGEATRVRFLHDAPLRSIVHVAAHSRVNSEFPLLSALILAPAQSKVGGVSGEIYSYEFYEKRFWCTRLVVLSVCDSTGAAADRPNEVFGLAMPLLAAGVPGVVGSLWSVDDGLAKPVLESFSRHLAAGMDASASLRAAQLESLGSREKGASLKVWSGFQVVGYSSPFTIH